ncbi:hypothetical protein [Terrisporobacter sp.]
MCYFLYGAISKNDYNKKFISTSLKYNIPVDDSFEYNSLISSKNSNNDNYIFFRLTNDYCDCNSPIGNADEINNKYLNTYNKRKDYLNYVNNIIDNFFNWLKDLKDLSSLNYIYFIKHWENGKFENECEKYIIHIDDINRDFFINLEDEIAYKIQLYKRYY